MKIFLSKDDISTVKVPRYIIRRYRILVSVCLMMTGLCVSTLLKSMWEQPRIDGIMKNMVTLAELNQTLVGLEKEAFRSLTHAGYQLWQVPDDPEAWKTFQKEMNQFEQQKQTQSEITQEMERVIGVIEKLGEK